MKYSLFARILHWLMALIIIALLGLGIYMVDFLSKEAANRMEIYNLHKSLGVVVIILITLRLSNRFFKKPPALPETMAKWEKCAANMGHLLLYLLMIIVPISGYLMSNSFGYPVMLFGLPMPFLTGTNFELGKIFSKTHEISAFALLGIIVIHVLGALKHRFFDRPENNVLRRMI